MQRVTGYDEQGFPIVEDDGLDSDGNPIPGQNGVPMVYPQPPGPVPPGKKWDSSIGAWVEGDQVPTPTPPPTPGDTSGGSTGGSSSSGATPPSFHAPTPTGLPSLPTVPNAPAPDLPTYTAPDPFKGPSADQILQDPSYLVREGRGKDALQTWAAARGTLNDTGTAKALIDYGQNSASQEYANIWNRDWNAYNTNVQTQYIDPFKFKYQGALDRYAPQFSQWQEQTNLNRLGFTTAAAWAQHQNDMGYSNAWNDYLEQQRQFELPLH